ncbi:hypothetical protein HNR19_003833 [Nocardioides thalensis]|uniref:Uncharacterized protein n=1 Tax=Nocardioides thalensis TaxID=1914755 RepID=A0A853C5P7_9ACTN|nr:hypothetical protein [Nocardioides thalensis]NYJ03135.1 hypothetical protein [Nocardioides thalensis]
MAPLFDLPAAPAAGTVDVPLTETPISRADQLLRDIKDNRAGINERMLGEVKMIAEWALEHTVAVPEDASTLTERGLDTGLPLAGEGAPLISDFAVLELGAILARGIDSVRDAVGFVDQARFADGPVVEVRGRPRPSLETSGPH